MDATVPPTDHSLPHLSICALVALLCRLFSAHCLAADAAFSNDNQRIYALSGTETKPALREINLSTKTARVIPLIELGNVHRVNGVASGDGGKILFVTDINLWAFDPRSRQAEKLCSAPPGTGFAAVAYDPKGGAIYITAQAEKGSIFKVKNGRELLPVGAQGDETSYLVFSSEGKVFYSESGYLWCGEIKSDGDNLRVEAERYATERQLLRPAGLDYLETPDGEPSGRSFLKNLAVARDGIYVQLWQYHNRGRGFGGLLKLPPPARRAEDETYSRMGQLAVKFLGETSYPVLLGASPDGSSVYYTKDDGEYLVTNGRTQKLQLRETDQKADTGASTSAGANSTEAKAEPLSSATRPSDVVAAAVAEREIDAISSQNIDTLVSFYADKVDLLDEGMVSKETVRKNFRQYFDRWPVTNWKLAGKVEVKPLTASRYQVTFPVTFEVSNPATNRRTVGSANETRIVAIDSAGAAKIVSQREKILRSRTVGR